MKSTIIQLVTLLLGILLGIAGTDLFFINKVRIDCTTQYLTTLGNVNYICYYAGAVKKDKEYLESQNTTE